MHPTRISDHFVPGRSTRSALGNSGRARRTAMALAAASCVALTACAGGDAGTGGDVSSTAARVTSSATADSSATGGSFAYRFTPGIIPASETKTTGPLLTKMNAIIGIPNGTTVKPLVIVMHGTHMPCLDTKVATYLVKGSPWMDWPDLCTPLTIGGLDGETYAPKGPHTPAYEAGLTYLTNALNKAGYPTLSIDVATVGANWLGENGDPLLQQDAVLAQHRKLVEDFVNGTTHGIRMPSNAAKMLSSKDYFIVGHSTSGGYAMTRATLNTDPHLRGSVGLQAGLSPHNEARPTKPLLRPTMAIYGTCDEDIRFDSDPIWAKELSAANPRWPYVQLAVKGGTHAGTNSLLNQAGVLDQARTHPGCAAPGAILSPQNLQDGTAAQVVAFISQVDAGATTLTLPTAATFPTTVMTSSGLKVRLDTTTMPRTSTAYPQPQAIDEQLLIPWDPKKDPVTAGGE